MEKKTQSNSHTSYLISKLNDNKDGLKEIFGENIIHNIEAIDYFTVRVRFYTDSVNRKYVNNLLANITESWAIGYKEEVGLYMDIYVTR